MPSSDTGWLEAPAYRELTDFLSKIGFEAAGVVAAKGNPRIAMAGFAAPQHASFATVPKHRAQAFVSFRSDFEDGSVFECSNMPVALEPPYPVWLTHRRRVGIPADALWSYFLEERPIKRMSEATLVRFLSSETEVMFRYQAWMAQRGGHTREELAARFRIGGKLPAGAEGETLLDFARNNEVEQALCNWWRLQADAPCPLEQVLDSLVIIHDELSPSQLVNAYWCSTNDYKAAEAVFDDGRARDAFARVVAARGARLRQVLQKRTPLDADFYLPSP